MSDVKYACPDCGSLDLMLRSTLVTPKSEVRCPNCAWQGTMDQTVAFATTQTVWDTERLGNVLLRVFAVHAAAPVIGVLEFAGILPRREERTPEMSEEEVAATEDHNVMVQKIRDAVMQRTTEAALTAAFTESEAQHRLYAQVTNTPLHPMLRADEPTAVHRKQGKRKRKSN